MNIPSPYGDVLNPTVLEHVSENQLRSDMADALGNFFIHYNKYFRHHKTAGFQFDGRNWCIMDCDNATIDVIFYYSFIPL